MTAADAGWLLGDRATRSSCGRPAPRSSSSAEPAVGTLTEAFQQSSPGGTPPFAWSVVFPEPSRRALARYGYGALNGIRRCQAPRVTIGVTAKLCEAAMLQSRDLSCAPALGPAAFLRTDVGRLTRIVGSLRAADPLVWRGRRGRCRRVMLAAERGAISARVDALARSVYVGVTDRPGTASRSHDDDVATPPLSRVLRTPRRSISLRLPRRRAGRDLPRRAAPLLGLSVKFSRNDEACGASRRAESASTSFVARGVTTKFQITIRAWSYTVDR